MIGLPYPNKNSVELKEKMKPRSSKSNMVSITYQRQDVITKLPGWITKRLKCPNSFSEAVTLTKTFFQEKGS
ncbi:hypothetical protein COOONC_11781 [Cooperia oncophora]